MAKSTRKYVSRGVTTHSITLGVEPSKGGFQQKRASQAPATAYDRLRPPATVSSPNHLIKDYMLGCHLIKIKECFSVENRLLLILLHSVCAVHWNSIGCATSRPQVVLVLAPLEHAFCLCNPVPQPSPHALRETLGKGSFNNHSSSSFPITSGHWHVSMFLGKC